MSSDRPGWVPMDRQNLLWFGVTVVVIVLVAVVWFAVSQASRPYGIAAFQQESVAACEAAVAEMLVAPATAAFESEPLAFDTSTDTGVVRGHVDSDNSFGAYIRSDYLCAVEVQYGQMTVEVASLS